MINARQDAAPALQAPNQPKAVSRGLQPSSGARFEYPRRCGGQAATANPCRRSQRRVSPDFQASLPRLHKGAGFIGQAAMVEHQAGHGFIGALGLRLGQRLAHVINGAQRNAKAGGVILEGLGVHLQGLHFARHDGLLHAGVAADVFVLADQRAVAAQVVFSGHFAVVFNALLAAIRIGDDRGVGLWLGQFAGNQVHGVHWSAPHFDEPSIGPLALSVNWYSERSAS